MAVVRQEAPGIPLEKLSERDLIDRVQRDDDERALEELVRRFLPLARGLAHRYVHTSEPGDDLVQVACVGFMAAVKRYDPSYGKPLRSFAIPTMLGELRRHFRDTGWAVHVPRRMQELGRDAQRAIVILRFGEELSQSEIGSTLGMSQMHVSRLLRRALTRIEAVVSA